MDADIDPKNQVCFPRKLLGYANCKLLPRFFAHRVPFGSDPFLNNLDNPRNSCEGISEIITESSL